MSERMDALLSVARRISTELRPKILDDLGIVAAIETHARELSRRVELAIELSLPDELPLENAVATAVYRIYQELLTNVIRHASARTVQITLTTFNGSVQLTCTDDGVGFDPARKSSGVGLAGIRERTRALGGQFSISALAPHGTEAIVVLPRNGR
jgi:signal transduction histidine kinase